MTTTTTAPHRSTRLNKVAPASTSAPNKKRQNHPPMVGSGVMHHPPDMAAGGDTRLRLYCQEAGAPKQASTARSGLYCQEITPRTASRRAADPPDAHAVRNRDRMRSACARLLEPLEERSYEGSSKQSIESPERNVVPSPPRADWPLQQPTKKPPTSFDMTSANHDHNVSELTFLTFRGLDPPERYQGYRAKSNVLGLDPPEGGVSGSRARPPPRGHTPRGKARQSTPTRRGTTPTMKQPSTNLRTSNIQRPSSLSQRSRHPSRTRSITPGKDKRESRRVTPKEEKRVPAPRSRYGTPSQNRSRTSSSGRRVSCSRSRTPIKNDGAAKQSSKQETAPIQSILRKKDAPPPSFDARSGGCDRKSCSSTSSSMSKKISPSHSIESESDSETISIDMTSVKSSGSIRSALRKGRFASSLVESLTSSYDDDDSSISSAFSTSIEGDGCSSNGSSCFKFDRTKSHFLRTADLGLTQDTVFPQQFLDDPERQTAEPHYHMPTPAPPPGIQFNIDENWVCVDDGTGGALAVGGRGRYSPIAPQAVDALVATSYRAACDPSLWTPTSKTRRYMTEKRLTFDSIPMPGPLFEGAGSPSDTCLRWTGKFPHRYHGSEIPAIRSQGIVNKSSEEVVDMLMDSSRVEEYNKTSVGRIDEMILAYGGDDCPFSGRRAKKLSGVVIQGSKIVDGCAFMESDDEENDETSAHSSVPHVSQFAGVTKLVRSRNRLPLVKKTSEFMTLLHCRELLEEQGGNGYIIVARSIVPAEETAKEKGVIKSEVLLNTYIIRRLHQCDKSRSVSVSESGRTASKKDLRNRCLIITLNHVKSPLIPRHPKALAKKIGLSAAKNHLRDIREASCDRRYWCVV